MNKLPMGKKSLYLFLVEQHNIYLPVHRLESLHQYVNDKISKGIDFFEVLYEIENDKSLKKYKNKNKGAYSTINAHVKWTDKSSRKVAQIDLITGKVIENHKSLYAATKALGISPNYCGNISNAANGKIGSACGFVWKFINK